MIHRLFIIIAVLLLNSPAHGLIVEFQETAIVRGVSVKLGDIATFDTRTELSRALASQVVAQSPPPGETTIVSANAVIQTLAPDLAPGTDIIWQGQANIKVTRASIRITPDRINQIIDDYLREHSQALPEAEIRFIPNNLPLPFLVPQGELSWDVVPANPNIIGSKRFSIIFRVDGRVRKNMSLKGKLEILAPVAVATTTLKKGTRIQSSHLSMAVQDISNLRSPCLDGSQVIGKVLKRSLKAGSPLTLDNVVFPPLIRKGQLVRIVVNHNGMQLTATGLAKGDGKLHDTIRVQNISSKKTVYCRVAAPGIVEVTL